VAGSLILFAIVRTLHGAPFGATTVSNSTVAIDVLHPTRRAEGIGYYGLSNNIATAISPTVALLLFGAYKSYDLLFWVAFITALIGLTSTLSVKLREREIVKNNQPLSLDRFILLKGWRQGAAMICYAFSYGVLATYIAIYGQEELGITGGTGLFFMLLAIGLILSRLVGGRKLRQGKVTQNASIGIAVSLIGYFVFATVHNYWGYYGAALIIGLGNGHMFPAFQTMFINLAPNSQRGTANSTLLVSWDIGIGIGLLSGGYLSAVCNFSFAFFVGGLLDLAAVILFVKYTGEHFHRNKIKE
jgi:predicted MFS family arabinose efflux permease